MHKAHAAQKIQWAFFGSSRFSVLVLDELEKLGLLPDLVVTIPGKPKGRGLHTSANEVKTWAEERDIAVLETTTLKTDDTRNTIAETGPWDAFLVASFGRIVPPDIFNMPKHGTLNIHPSLLPKLRGPSPLEYTILSLPKEEVGVSVMKIDAEVDHGPILSQKTVRMADEWPPYYSALEIALASEGAHLFAKVLPEWVSGKLMAHEQDHSLATFSKKISKEETLINLADDPEKNLRKIRAFADNRPAYFLHGSEDSQKRVIVSRARIENDKLVLETVKPEGKNEMAYEDFLRGQQR